MDAGIGFLTGLALACAPLAILGLAYSYAVRDQHQPETHDMSTALGDAIKHLRRELESSRERVRSIEHAISNLQELCRHTEGTPSADSAGNLHHECIFCGRDRIEKPEKMTSCSIEAHGEGLITILASRN